MKPFTREIRAGLIPEGLLEDKRVTPKAMALFAVLTLYAEPDGEWNEWECDFSASGPLPEQWQGLDLDKSASLSQLEYSGYIKELLEDENVVYFSFPDGVKGVIAVEFEEVTGTDTKTPAEAAGGDEDKAEGQEVGRSAPAAYAEKTSRKVYECEKCSEEIPKGGKVYQRYAGGPRYCEKCVPVEEESKAPLTPGTTPPGDEGRKEEPVDVTDQVVDGAATREPIKGEVSYHLAADFSGNPDQLKKVLREALEEYLPERLVNLEQYDKAFKRPPAEEWWPMDMKTIFRKSLEEYEAEKRDVVSVEELEERAAAQLAAEQSLHDRVAASIDKLLAEQNTRHKGGTTVAELEELVREQDLIETALGVEITRRLDGDGFLSGPALRIIDTTARTVGEFLAERGICFTQKCLKRDAQNAQICEEWHKTHTDLSSREGRKEAAEGQG